MRFLDDHGGGFDPLVYAPYQVIDDVELDQPRGNHIFALFTYTTLFRSMICHQSTGQGTPGTFPPLAGSEWVQAPEPGRIIRLVLDGGHGPITVKGQQFPASSAMPPWKENLKDEEIAAVLTYVRGNQAWG